MEVAEEVMKVQEVTIFVWYNSFPKTQIAQNIWDKKKSSLDTMSTEPEWSWLDIRLAELAKDNRNKTPGLFLSVPP